MKVKDEVLWREPIVQIMYRDASGQRHSTRKTKAKPLNEHIKRHDSYKKMEQVFSDNTLSCVHFSGSLNITTVQHEALKHCYTHYYSLSEACVI